MSNKGFSRTLWSVLLSFIVCSATAAQFNLGDHITVAESSVNPSVVVQVNITGLSTGDITYSGGVYAGINQLLINGSEIVNGFCIDPFHFSSSSSLPYTVVDLTGAPKGHPMSPQTATYIERLWGSFYSPTMGAQNAAGFQIAIWELVDPSGFHLTSGNDYGAGAMLSTVMASDYSGPTTANLVALTGSGQDYVVQSVPDGGTTVSLLGLGLLALAAAKRQFRIC
jgi:hypothetical protein